MRYVFIVNPISGKQEGEAVVIPEIHRSMSELGCDYTVVKTEYPGHAKQLARDAASIGDPVRICACGGDGTLSETVAGAYEFPNVEFAAYPCGSGNDFIKCFGNAEQYRDIQAIAQAESRPVDLLRINDAICLNTFSVGVDADVAGAMNRWRKYPLFRGSIAYDLATVECILKPLGKRLRIRIGDETVEGCYTLVSAGNGGIYGGHYKALPLAQADDGLIDFLTVDKISLLRLVPLLSIYERGEHLTADGQVADGLKDCIRFYRTDRIEIDADEEFCFGIDGEVQMGKHVLIEMLHHKMRFAAPPSAAGEH